MKELILGDIHQKYKLADQIIKKEKPDKIYCLGDLWDDYHDLPQNAEDMCKWTLDNLEETILGNHDQHYLSSNFSYQCSGYTYAKHEIIMKYFPPEVVRKRFKLYHVAHGFLLTHAGLTDHLISRWDKNDKTLDQISSVLDKAWEYLRVPYESHPFLDIGRDRGGPQEYGGVTWCDWFNFKPVEGIPQIFGHTPDPLVKTAVINHEGKVEKRYMSVYGLIYTAGLQTSLCLDTHLKHYAVFEGGALRVLENN